MVRQEIIKGLGYGALVRSQRGNTYNAIFKSRMMKLPVDCDTVEVEFVNNTPVITRFYHPIKEEIKTLEEQEKEFLELGGNY